MRPRLGAVHPVPGSRAAGVTRDIRAPWDTAWGTREFHVRDLDGHGLQFYRPRG